MNEFNEYIRGSWQEAWLAENILFMDEPTFENTQYNGDIQGIYKFASHLRMYNFLSSTEAEQEEFIAAGTLLTPMFHEVPDIRMFLEPRADFPYAEVTDRVARSYLDQNVRIPRNVTENLRDSMVRPDEKTLSWVAANIRHMDSQQIWMPVPAFTQVAKRMQNWLNMHESWREEFMNIAFIPFRRTAVIWDPNHPENLDCLRDAPHHNAHLPLTEQVAHDFLNRISTFRFCPRQVTCLFTIWRLKNPRYRRFLREFVVQEDNRHHRKLNWLTLHVGWKGIFYRRFERELNNNQ